MQLPQLWIPILLLAVSVSGAQPMRIEVRATDSDRRDAIASVRLPGLTNRLLGLQANGQTLLAQVDGQGLATFIVPRVAKGQLLAFDITDPPKAQPAVTVTRRGQKLSIAFDGKLILEYQAELGPLPRPDIPLTFKRGGYLHPVFSPAARRVTDDFPLKHVHHHGIWFPWTKTEFEGRQPDFWNSGAGTGRVEPVRVLETWQGPAHGGFKAQHRFLDLTAPQPKVALEETWTVRMYRLTGGERPRWVFDLESAQTCASASPLILPLYRYGGLGVRGNAQWDENASNPAKFLTANGDTDRVQAHATRARWCHMGGLVDGQPAGLAILCHPDNFRFPQPMRIHPNEPFFNFAPQQFGPMAIRPGETYLSRYRFIVVDGAPDRVELDGLWQDFANPLNVDVVVK